MKGKKISANVISEARVFRFLKIEKFSVETPLFIAIIYFAYCTDFDETCLGLLLLCIIFLFLLQKFNSVQFLVNYETLRINRFEIFKILFIENIFIDLKNYFHFKVTGWRMNLCHNDRSITQFITIFIDKLFSFLLSCEQTFESNLFHKYFSMNSDLFKSSFGFIFKMFNSV